MSRFSFIAQDKYRAVRHGELEARNQEEVIALLQQRGLSPIKIEALALGEEGRAPSIFKKFSLHMSIGGRLTTLDQITTIRHLGTILNTGTDLLASLEIIAKDAIKPLVKKILYDIKEKISRGEKFSDALEAWRYQFGPIFLSLVKAGENSGNLPTVLLNYSQELRKEYAFMRKLRGALVYPIILIVALLLMVVIVLTVVTPRLKEVFRSTKVAPPFYTKFFFAASDFWLAHMISIGIVAGVFAVLIAILLQNNKTRRYMGLMVWYLPLFNRIQKNLILSRFSKTTAHLLEAGFPLKTALITSSEVVSLKYKEVLTEIAGKKLEKGIPFSQALLEYKSYFPSIMVSVIATGEKSGQLSQVLAQMGEFYEEEVTYALELFLTLIEPALLIIVGVIVGLIASSLISPLYRLIGKIR